MASLSSLVQARPVELYGNANGLWSPTHPHLTSNRDKPKSPVRYTPPPPPPEAPETESTSVEAEPIKGCPTLLSAPHLCTPEQLEASG